MDMEKAKVVYEALRDEESKFIFGRRLMYSLTRDDTYIQDIVARIPEVQWLKAEIVRGHENFLFGAGNYGKTVMRMAPGHWIGILDNDNQKWGGYCDGVPVFPPETLLQHPEARVFLAVRRFGKKLHLEIAKQLEDMGINPARVIRVDRDVIERLEQTQYFDLPALSHDAEETFVDAGGFDGLTSLRFAAWAKTYRRIFVFEPEDSIRKVCEEKLQQLPSDKVTVYPLGTWKEDGELRFSKMSPGCSLVDDAGDIRIPVTSIDNACKGEKVTFIKMDVEGSEKETLEGARQTIVQQHPKLAICLYHKPEDIVELPAYVLSLCPTYRLYLRHYSLLHHETVLYAV